MQERENKPQAPVDSKVNGQASVSDQNKEAHEMQAKTIGARLSKAVKWAGLVALVLAGWFIAVQILAAERYEAKVMVIEGQNKIGINPSTDLLDFGDLSRNNSSTRLVSLKNNSGSEKYIKIIKYGRVSSMMNINQTSFTMEAGEETQLEFTVLVPPSAENREYRGKVLIFKWPKLF